MNFTIFLIFTGILIHTDYFEATFQLKNDGLNNPKQYLMDRLHRIHQDVVILYQTSLEKDQTIPGLKVSEASIAIDTEVHPHLMDVGRAFLSFTHSLKDNKEHAYHRQQLMDRGLSERNFDAIYRSTSGPNSIQNLATPHADKFKAEHVINSDMSDETLWLMLQEKSLHLDYDLLTWVARALAELDLRSRRILLVYILEQDQGSFHNYYIKPQVSSTYSERVRKNYLKPAHKIDNEDN